MSGLANYEMGASYAAHELMSSFEKSEIELIREQLMDKPVMHWSKWRIEHHELICHFVSSTPSARKKLKKFQEHHLLLTMAGIQLCQEAAVLIRAITAPPIVAGGSYRDMAALAGDAYNRLIETDVPYWPFSDTPSPFSDDPAKERKYA